METRWGAVAVLILAGVISALQVGKAAIAVPILQHDLALTLVAAALIVGAYGVLGALIGLPAGIASALLPARVILIAGLAAAGLGSFAGSFADSAPLLIATRVVEGSGSLAASLAIPRLLRAATAPHDRDTVFAVFGAHLPTGSLIALLAGPPALGFGWQAVWMANGAVALGCAALVAGLRIDEPAATAPVTTATLAANTGTVLASPGPLLLALAFGLYTSQYLALSGLLPTLLVDRLGLSIAAAGTVSAVAVAANAVGNMAAGALLRFGAPLWGVMAVAFAAMGLATVGIFAAWAPVAVVMALAALSLGLTGLIPASIYAAAPRVAPTAATLAITLGLINQVTNLGNLAGPAAMAFTVERLGWSGAPLLFGAVAVTGVAVAWRLRRALAVPPR